jgi:hypothetical protein
MTTQAIAIALIETGKNVFLTAGAGRGKSWVIRQITNKNTILVAPTGAAALNIQGSTCHKIFGLPIGVPTKDDYAKISTKVRKLLSSRKLKRIIIDEISMVRADMLDLINHRLQQARENKLPFGGVQMVVVGDFYQLNPIVGQRDHKVFYQEYDTPYAFGSDAWNFEVVSMEKAYRQDNETQVKVLDTIREGSKWSWRAVEWLHENARPYDAEQYNNLHLTCYKEDAARINTIHYNKIEEEEHTYTGYTSNPSKWDTAIPVEEVVRLKKGTRVIFCANDPEGAYVNGQRGVVVRLTVGAVIVQMDDTGTEVEVLPFTWETYTYNTGVSGLKKTLEHEYVQIPLLLSWAITSHKSQGMTLDNFVVDMGRGAFTHGQAYVMVSRAKDLTRMSFASNFSTRDLILDNDVVEFYNNIKRVRAGETVEEAA